MSLPLAYVFWHKPLRGTSLAAYEKGLSVFHRSLRAHPPNGLVDALCFREDTLPWRRRGSTAYEDWYLVRDFQSLGALNEGANRKSHDGIAGAASVVAGGLYRRRRGDLRLQDATYATWVRKPPQTSYEDFLGGLAEMAVGRTTDLWQRQMVLGPAPEFCLHSGSPIEIPKDLRHATLRVRLVAESGP
jgi:hypothetical protein